MMDILIFPIRMCCSNCSPCTPGLPLPVSPLRDRLPFDHLTSSQQSPSPTSPLPCRIHGAPHNAVDPATGQPFFSPRINKTGGGRRRRQRSEPATSNTCGIRLFRNSSTAARERGPWQETGGEGHEGGIYDGDDLPIHASLWERGLALEKRREAGARSREEARKARASAGHVNGRSAELVQAMRVRSLIQTYRTLLASVEYARLPEGLDYDEVT